jgi:hypothetical protein
VQQQSNCKQPISTLLERPANKILTLGSGDVDDGAVVLENINFLNALDVGQGHLLQNAAKLLVI